MPREFIRGQAWRLRASPPAVLSLPVLPGLASVPWTSAWLAFAAAFWLRDRGACGPQASAGIMDGMVAALMLDFYGTVVHEDDAVITAICAQVASTLTAPVPPGDIARQWSGWFADECASSAGQAFKSQRDAVRASLVRLLDALGSPEDPDQLTLAQFAYWRRPPLFEDAREFLRRIEIPVCVVSNIDRADIEAAINYHGLTFDHVVTSEDARSYKPRPELFERGLDLLGVRRDAVLHAGDSLSSDVTGANSAGVPVAWVNRSARPRPPQASLWAEVASLAELAELLTTR